MSGCLKPLRCGLIGRKLSHSFSPLIHSFAGNYDYRLIEIEPENADDFILNGEYDCINVTIPYKENAYRLCDELSEEARMIGAVNTLVRRGGKLFGYNTDFYGFKATFERMGINPSGKKCVVLGSGGASKMAVYALKTMSAEAVAVVSRSGVVNYVNVYDECRDAEIIVNTTPKGMYPEADESPLDISKFGRCEFVFDLIFNPSVTRLLYDAGRCGIKTAGGLYMLVAQGLKAGELFTGNIFEAGLADKVYAKVTEQTMNLVLIGMPGCGKSSVGREAAKLLQREFVDVDEFIENEEGRTIPEIFRSQGEAAFREIETKATERICKRSGLVIATGGGVVTRPDNYFWLACNGVVCYLKRPLEELTDEGRPVSQSKGIKKIYEERRGFYETWCDFSVESFGDGSYDSDKYVYHDCFEHIQSEGESEDRSAEVIKARALAVCDGWRDVLKRCTET